MVSFPIYQPEEDRFRLTPNWIVLGLILSIFGVTWLFDSPHSEFRSDWTMFAGLAIGYFLISSWWKYEPLNGAINGIIKFESDSIIEDGKTYHLKDIINLDFRFVDFYGKRSTNGRDFNPKLSQGVNNYVTFTYSAGEDQVIYFQLRNKDEYKSLSPFINEAIKLKKMQFKDGIDLVGIENVSI